MSGPSVDVQVEYQGLQSDVATVPVVPSRPGVFSLDGSGQGPALRGDSKRRRDRQLPVESCGQGPNITIYATGGGERDPAVADGQILSDVLTKTSLGTSVWFDNGPQYDISAYGEVLYAGGSPGSVSRNCCS